MKKQYKEFNLKEALQGNVKVETKRGYKVKDMYLFEDTNNLYPLVVLLERKPGEDVGDFIYQYNKEGKFDVNGDFSVNDLQMYTEVQVCYVNVYITNENKLYVSQAYDTKQSAVERISTPSNSPWQYIKTIEITEQTTEDVSNDDDCYNELGQNDIDGLMRYVIKNLVNS